MGEKKKINCNYCKTEGMHNTSCCIHKANAEKTRPGTVATVEEEIECNAIRGESDDEGNNMETDEVDQSIAPETSHQKKRTNQSRSPTRKNRNSNMPGSICPGSMNAQMMNPM